MKQIIILLVGIFIWNACDMPLHENFVEVEKPPKELQIGMYLAADKDGETVIVYKPTQIGFIVKAEGKRVDMTHFQLGEKQWMAYEEEGAFYVDPENFPEGSYTLVCRLSSKTHSGSIKDQIDYEYYEGEIAWPVEIKYEMPPAESTVTVAVDENGQMKISWQKPYMKYKQFLRYELIGNGLPLAMIEDADQLFFIDTAYAGGNQSYAVRAVLTDNGTEEVWDLGTVLSE